MDTIPSRMIDIAYLRRALKGAEDALKQARWHVRETEVAQEAERAFGWRCREVEAMEIRDYLKHLVREAEGENGE